MIRDHCDVEGGSVDAGGLVHLATVKRNSHPESWHFGAMVMLDAKGRIEYCLGDRNLQFFPRSAWKPVQGVAMLAMGLGLTGEDLAIACSSHSGRPDQLAGVERILERAGLSAEALSNNPGHSLDVLLGPVGVGVGSEPSRLTMNCSGKHAAMLLTSAVNGWSTSGDYLDPTHPVQQGILETARRLAGSSVRPGGPDGCGAPTYTCSLVGLAQAFRVLASSPEGSYEHAVYDAFTSYPGSVAGPGRRATRAMTSARGVIAKDGAEGVFAMGFPDGGAMALKIADGNTRVLEPLISLALKVKAHGARLAADEEKMPHGVEISLCDSLSRLTELAVR